jgi:hypothetical protein
MSKFIKLIPIIFVVYMANACCAGGDCGNTYKFFDFPEFFYDDQGDVVISYEANLDNPNSIKKYTKFNTDTYKWEASEVTEKVIADEQIATFGKTIIKNSDNAVVFEQSIPSISDIQSQTKISLPNAEAYYNYFRIGDDYRWDRKTILIKVGINKKTDEWEWGSNSFTGIHSFLAEYNEINTLWNIKHLHSWSGDLNSASLDLKNSNSFYSSYSKSSWGYRAFVNANISLCHQQDGGNDNPFNSSIKCLVKYKNGEVSLQKLYGEILPAQYADVLKGLDQNKFSRPATSRVFFDKNQNLYAFYSNTEEAKGKYFYFEMYKPDQPTVAQHKQKIYWD